MICSNLVIFLEIFDDKPTIFDDKPAIFDDKTAIFDDKYISINHIKN